MEWRAGDRVIVRGADWRVIDVKAFSDCQALDLEHGATGAVRTLLVPFDRPRMPPRPHLAVVSRRRWAREVRQVVLASFPYGGLRCCPPAIRLMAYQLEPALAMLRHGATRVLIADGVGLGKTIEAGLVIRELAARDPDARVLILCPAALSAQWIREMARLFDVAAVHADALWLRQMARTVPVEVNPWSLSGVHLASIDFVKRPEALRPLEDVRWDLLVVDEAHVATCGSDRRAAVDALAKRARRVVLLTATPHSGDDDQFRALCALGRMGDDPLVVFSRDRSDTPLGPSALRSRVLPVRLGAAELQVHRRLDAYARRLWEVSARAGRRGAGLLATMLSKRGLSSPASLAISLRRRRTLLAQAVRMPLQIQLPLDDGWEDEASDAILCERGLDDPEEEARLLEDLAGAATAAARDESKLRVLLRFIRRAREPALIFSEYRDTAARLHAALASAGHAAALLHGGLSEEERARAIARLARGEAHLVATDAASEGLNLHQACRIVVHFELPWTPARLRQRCGRLDRIGQTRCVHEVALVACDTSEHLVLAPLLARAARAGSLGRQPLMQRLGESQIAAHLLGGAPVTPAPPELPPGTVRVDLGREAEAEVARLEQLRRLEAGAPGTRPPRRRTAIVPATVVGRRNPHVPRGLHLVFALRVRDGTAAPLLQEVVVLSDDVPMPVQPLGRADLRRLVQAVVRRLTPAVAEAMGRLAAVRAEEVRPLRELAARRLLRRERHADGLRSAAEDLVQAGLFDRRALRARAARQRAAEALRQHDGARVSSLAGRRPLETTYELVAVLIGGGS